MWGRAASVVAAGLILAAAVAGCGSGTKMVEKTVTTKIVPPAQNLSLAHQTLEGLPGANRPRTARARAAASARSAVG
jgi:hypothetical protein